MSGIMDTKILERVSDCEELVGGQLQEMMEMQLPRVLVFKWKIL